MDSITIFFRDSYGESVSNLKKFFTSETYEKQHILIKIEILEDLQINICTEILHIFLRFFLNLITLI